MEIVRPFQKQPELNHEGYNDNFLPFVIFPKLFSEAEVARIRNLWNEERVEQGKIGNKVVDYDIRKSKIMFIQPGENDWIYDKLSMACIITNANRYKFDISGFQTKLQLTQYAQGDFFGWHMDFGPGKNSLRKLSITVQLSDANEYEAGELQFPGTDGNIDMPKEKGTAIIFPSYLYHRVVPVKSGCRMSIVGWIAGPPYR